jgi:Archaeal putative transposase ISC1217.
MIKGMGKVKVIISEGINGRRYYATNRTEWPMKNIMETYLRRWDIEVIHRDIKRDGLSHIFLRKLCKTELYLHLMVTGRVILEIASIMSLKKYHDIPDRIEKRKRWINIEFLESLFDTFRRYGDLFVAAVKQSMLKPYKSTRNVMKFGDKLNHGVVI